MSKPKKRISKPLRRMNRRNNSRSGYFLTRLYEAFEKGSEKRKQKHVTGSQKRKVRRKAYLAKLNEEKFPSEEGL